METGLLIPSPVKIGWPSDTHEAVGVGQFGENADLVVAFEQYAHSHEWTRDL